MDMHNINIHVLEKKAIDLGQPISNLSAPSNPIIQRLQSNIFLICFKKNKLSRSDINKVVISNGIDDLDLTDFHSMHYQL